MTASLPVPHDPREGDAGRDETATPAAGPRPAPPPKPAQPAAEAAARTAGPPAKAAKGRKKPAVVRAGKARAGGKHDRADSGPAGDMAPTGIVIPPRPPAPVVEEPVAEEPVAEEPVVEEPVVEPPVTAEPALVLRGVTKSFHGAPAVEGIDLVVPAGTFYGLVGPNGAGKTTTLAVIAGLLAPDSGTVLVGGIDARAHPRAAKRAMGVLPDRVRTFDRLTGRQLLYYFGMLRGLEPDAVRRRTDDLARAFDIDEALARPVSDYSAGMTKKVMLAGAMIHAPRLLVLDEPFDAVDPVSSGTILDILGSYVRHGGTVIMSSHGMEMIERVCTRVAVIVAGRVLAEGTVDEVRGELTLQERFTELTGGSTDPEGLEWLHTFSG